MAQADDSAPRKTTTYKRFEGMASQNERYNTKPDEMFWLENIMRVSPKRLHSVPGPSGPLLEFPQPCPADTPRNHQVLEQSACTNVQTGYPPGTLSGNSRASWAHVSDGVAIIAVKDVLSTKYQVLQVNVSNGIVIQELTPITTPFFGTILLCGQSDEDSYAFFGGVGGGDFATWYFSWPNQNVTRFLKTYGGSGFGGGPFWAKNKNFFYVVEAWFPNSGTPHEFLAIKQFSFPGTLQPDGTYLGNFVQDNTTSLVQPTTSDPSITCLSVQATDNYVYVLVDYAQAGTNPGRLYKFNASDLTLADFFQFDYYVTTNATNNAMPITMSVVSDNLVYIMRTSNINISSGTDPANAIEFGYVDWTTHAYEYIDRVSNSTLTCAGITPRSPITIFENGNFYYGTSASDLIGGKVNIAKVSQVECPGVFYGGLQVSRIDFQFPDAAVKGRVYYGAFSVPDTNFGKIEFAAFKTLGTPDSGMISDAYFSVPAPITELVIVKSADETFSSTSLTGDPELKFAMDANDVWVIYMTVNNDADLGWPGWLGLLLPSGATSFVLSPDFLDAQDISGGPAGTITFQANLGSAQTVVAAVVNGVNAGDCQLAIAEQILGNTPVLKKYSTWMAYKQ